MRYTAPNGTAGFARSRVKGHRRSPCPPASNTPIASRISDINNLQTAPTAFTHCHPTLTRHILTTQQMRRAIPWIAGRQVETDSRDAAQCNAKFGCIGAGLDCRAVSPYLTAISPLCATGLRSYRRCRGANRCAQSGNMPTRPPANLSNPRNAWNSNQIKHFRILYQFSIRIPPANTSPISQPPRPSFHKNHLTPDTRIDYKMPHNPVHVPMRISPIACDNVHGRCTVKYDTASYQSEPDWG